MKSKESLYFLAIVPNTKICEEVRTFKQLVFEKFGSKAALRSPAHITLHMPFKWRDDKEEHLINKLSKFEFGDFPFSIELRDFSFFSPRVVFINVLENEKLQSLQKELSRYVRRELNVFNADYKDKPFHPHMTIAFRDLKKSTFSEAEAFFSNQKYRKDFQVNQICLLKHNGKVWQEYEHFTT